MHFYFLVKLKLQNDFFPIHIAFKLFIESPHYSILTLDFSIFFIFERELHVSFDIYALQITRLIKSQHGTCAHLELVSRLKAFISPCSHQHSSLPYWFVQPHMDAYLNSAVTDIRGRHTIFGASISSHQSYMSYVNNKLKHSDVIYSLIYSKMKIQNVLVII